jgi:hypothetical protein
MLKTKGPYLWIMKRGMLAILLLTAGLARAQSFYSFAQIDGVGLAVGQEMHWNDKHGLGLQIKIGNSQAFSLGPSGYLRFREHMVYGIHYQRRINSMENLLGRPNFHLDSGQAILSILPPIEWVWDLGIRGGYITTIDHNPKHGFSHGSGVYAYAALRKQLNPWFQIGTEIGAGVHDEAMIYAGTLQFRASLFTPYLNPANWN